MKLTQIQKELLYESAKRLFLEAGNELVPSGAPQASSQKQPGSNSNTSGGQQQAYDAEWEGYEEYRKGDEFDPKDFRDVVENIFTSYKHILSATKDFIKTVGVYILRYQRGDIIGSRLSVLIQTALDRPTKKQPGQATKRSLNRAGETFNQEMEKLMGIISSTNTPFNKRLYIFFYKYLEELRQEHIEKTDDYFHYLAYLNARHFKTFDFAKHIPDKSWVEKLHELSFEAESWVDKKLKKYYKMMFEDVGTNKGFYRSVRDMFMKSASHQTAREPDTTNAYTGYEPDYSKQSLELKGNIGGGRDKIYYVEYNRLLNQIHDLTKQYIASNYRDQSIKEKIDSIREEIRDLEKKRFEQRPDADLQRQIKDIENRYKGPGAWSDFRERGGRSPETRDPKRDRYRSKESPQQRPHYSTGNYDPDLEDYRKKK